MTQHIKFEEFTSPFSKESLLRCFLCQHPIQKYTNPAIVRSVYQLFCSKTETWTKDRFEHVKTPVAKTAHNKPHFPTAQNVSHDDPTIGSKNPLHGWPISETDTMPLHSWVRARYAQNTKTGVSGWTTKYANLWLYQMLCTGMEVGFW